ncbi:hypothetical protein LDENG_00174000 [Lucifuga dentata]|nr:hypothetical protein LDENG_00174000 [Lucifuga dentata]
MGELTFIHTLTGWIPEITPIKSIYAGKIWDFLKGTIPIFTHPDENLLEKPEAADPAAGTDSCLNDCKSTPEPEKGKGTPEIMVCAGYYPFQPFNNKAFVFGQMADSSASLRQCGFSLMYSHIVLLTRTRDCQLEAPPKQPPVPRWKLIRHRKEIVVTDEPQKPTLSKPEQFIKLASPFLTYCITRNTNQITELEAKQSAQKKQSYSSPLVPIAERQEAEYSECPEPDAAECTANSPNSTDSIEVTAEDRKDNDGISNDLTKTEPQEPQTQELPAPIKPMLQETWMDLDDFAKCFQALLVFHKPHRYPHQFQKSQFKSSIPSKTITSINAGIPSHSASAVSILVSSVVGSLQCPEERGTHYLYVDSLQPTKILISFSALLLWGETAKEKKEMSATCRSAVLLAQPHCWKSLQSQLPVLTIKTTTSKAAMLSLPPGCHVLRIQAKAALGYHVHLCSMTPFIFGDEETVMSHLTKESVRFNEQAMSILRALAGVVAFFSDEQNLPAARQELEKAHCPQNINTTLGKWEHHRVFNMAVYHMLHETLGRKLSTVEWFAVQALTEDPSLLKSEPREHSPTQSKPPEDWGDRQNTDKENQAATVLQAGFKGHLVRKILNASKPGTKENLSASKTLLDMWTNVESDAEKHAAFLLRSILSHSEGIAELYPCQQDDWAKIAYADYSVPLPDIANSWALVFREVFLVPKEILLVPKVYSPVPRCLLHIINNDTGEELHMVFSKVAPRVYQPNKLGYTFVAEAITPESPPVGAKWRMRLIGSREPLPKPACETPLNKFSVKKFQDYYIPNDKNIICRYSVHVKADLLATVQFQTSKPDVLIQLSILDHEKEVASKTGKGHVVIPVFTFQSNKAEESQSKNGSPTQDNGVEAVDAPLYREREEDTAKQTDSSSNQNHPPTETMGHKYVVQADVLYKSWALDESQLAFVQILRDWEKNEIKGEKNEELTRSFISETPSKDQLKSGTPKSNRKGEGDKEKGKPTARKNRQETAVWLCSRRNTLWYCDLENLDLTKPNWTLHVVSDQNKTDSIKVKKDTERADQIKAMKQAWEAAEPGRSAKALQTRLKFLNQGQHRKSDDKTADELTADDTEDREPYVSGLHASTSLSPSDSEELTPIRADTSNYLPMDYTPFIRCQREFPVLKDSQMEETQQRERSEKIQAYQLIRDTVLEHRKQEAFNRKDLMRRQLETYENIQAALWECRKKFLDGAESLLSNASHKKRTRGQNSGGHPAS